MRDTVRSQALQRAARILGGKDRLRKLLRVSGPELDRWMSAAERPPMDAFLAAVDVISENAPADVRSAAFLQAGFEPRDDKALLETALDAALFATGAEMGNVQLACPDGLRIVAHRGFGKQFLDFYAVVDDSTPASCSAAKKTLRRIVVFDVASHPIFAGTPAEEIMAAAGVRGVQSTPLVGRSGTLLGMLNTHFASPRDLTRRDEEVLDKIARHAALCLDGGARAG